MAQKSRGEELTASERREALYYLCRAYADVFKGMREQSNKDKVLSLLHSEIQEISHAQISPDVR